MTMSEWLSEAIDFEHATDNEVESCYEKARGLDEGYPSARRVSDTTVIKRVGFDGEREFANLSYAYKHVNGKSLIVVPQPVRLVKIRDEWETDVWYLIMGYLDGHRLAECHHDQCIKAASTAIMDMHQQTCTLSTVPGPPHSRYDSGFPWGLDKVQSKWKNVEDLENFMCRRLQDGRLPEACEALPGALFAHDCALVMNHRDLSPRNILCLPDGRIGIVDWHSMAFYPPTFDLAAIQHCSLTASDAGERRQALALLRTLLAGGHYLWSNEKEISSQLEKLCAIQRRGISYSLPQS